MSCIRDRMCNSLSLGVMGIVVLTSAGCGPAAAGSGMAEASPSTIKASLVFDGVTVVDVERGELFPDQRVIIAGNRIAAVGGVDSVKIPKGAQVVDARTKYLIPGLWDMHVHPWREGPIFYPLFLAYGVTGIRDAGTNASLDTLSQWRQEILAGDRVGPPRQLFSGRQLSSKMRGKPCVGRCLRDSASARRVVDSLKSEGVDMIKAYLLAPDLFFVIAAEARRLGLPIGGHIETMAPTASEASDSGMRIIDHPDASGGVGPACWGRAVRWPRNVTPRARSGPGTVEECRLLAERFKRNGTWWTLTIAGYMAGVGPRQTLRTPAVDRVYTRFSKRVRTFWSDSAYPGAIRLSDSSPGSGGNHDTELPAGPPLLGIVKRVGFPVLAATDVGASMMRPGIKQPGLPGLMLHAELEMYVAEGFSTLDALRTATLNPAKFLHGTDSLGTVAPGKLADLVLLDADPLEDIANTQTIRAVVANGHYFDRATLDSVLASARAMAKRKAKKRPYGIPLFP